MSSQPHFIRCIAWLLCSLLLAAPVACGDSSEEKEPTVDDNNQLPTFSELPAQVRVRAGDVVELNVVAEDPDGDDITLSLDSGPETARFVAPGSIGRFAWSPLNSDAAPDGKEHDVIFAAVDSKGGRATQRVVILVESSDGAPRFVTSNQRVVDLTRVESLSTRVAVKDDDSTNVTLTLQDGPSGMELTQSTSKEASLSWTPNPEQIAKKSVWTAVIEASDDSGLTATQTLNIILVTKRSGEDCDDSNACGCTEPPTIEHSPLGDQRGVDDYVVQATIQDAETTVASPAVFWTTGDPEDLANYEALPMTDLGDDLYQASIPNPLLPEGQSAPIFYFVCALDDDDPNGEECDNFACTPEQAVYQFTAYPAGDQSCRPDLFEPNDSTDNAKVMEGEQVIVEDGLRQAYGLTLCENDSDLFVFNLQQGDGFSALAVFAEGAGVQMRILDSDGLTVLADSSSESPTEQFASINAPSTGNVYLEIFGGPGTYTLLADIEPAPDVNCTDTLEPNDTPEQASTSLPGEVTDLTICAPNDLDFFRIPLQPGDTFEALTVFNHASGDLDAYLFDPVSGAQLALSESNSDDEYIEWVNTPGHPEVLLVIQGYEGASNTYSILSDVIPANASCTDDNFEPNNEVIDAASVQPLEYNLSMCSDTDDFFKIALSPHDRVRTTLTFDANRADLDVMLIDPDGETPILIAETVESPEVLTYQAIDPGVYYFWVYRASGDELPYRAAFDLCTADNAEPNDTPEQAGEFDEGLALDRTVCLSDVDYYTVEVPAAGVIDLELEFPQGAPANSSDVAIRLFAQGSTDVLATGSPSEGGMILAAAVEAGTYTISVSDEAQTGAPIAYDMIIEVQ